MATAKAKRDVQVSNEGGGCIEWGNFATSYNNAVNWGLKL